MESPPGLIPLGLGDRGFDSHRRTMNRSLISELRDWANTDLAAARLAQPAADRIAELERACANERDLSDSLAMALKWYVRDQNIPARQAADEALAVWENSRGR